MPAHTCDHVPLQSLTQENAEKFNLPLQYIRCNRLADEKGKLHVTMLVLNPDFGHRCNVLC